MNSDAEICRQGPRGCRPDHYENIFARKGSVDLSRIGSKRKFYIDRRRRVLAVLNLGLGERRLVVDAPINGTQALVNVTAFEKLAEKTRGRRFVFRRHREIRVFPLAQNPQPLKIARLVVHRRCRVFATDPAKRRDRDIVFVLPFFGQFLFDDGLDRQTVTVIPRHIRRVVAHHRTGFYDEIFEYLI